MDIERALICKTLADRALLTVIDKGVKEEFFPSPEHSSAYRWMLEYYREYGEPPTGSAFKQNFPAYKLVKVKEPLDYIYAELRRLRIFSMVDDVLFDATEMRKDGAAPEEMVSLFATAVSNIHTEVIELKDCDATLNGDDRLSYYDELENLPDGMRGVSFGLPSIDEVTSGAEAGQLITIIGEPKVGKSTMMLRTAIAAHEAGNLVLFIGFEMSNTEQLARYDAMRAKVSHARLITGKLIKSEKARITKLLRAKPDEDTKPFIFSQDVLSVSTLSGVQAKIQQYNPDVVYVDGVYMMDDEQGEDKGSPRHLTNLTRGFKRMAQQLDIPIIITTQVLTWKLRKREGRRLTGDSIGYSSSFAQDSDLILGVEHTEKDDQKRVTIVLSRNSARVETLMEWDWETGEFEEYDGSSKKLGPVDDDDEEVSPFGEDVGSS